jgi:hypothetical protein
LLVIAGDHCSRAGIDAAIIIIIIVFKSPVATCGNDSFRKLLFNFRKVMRMD